MAVEPTDFCPKHQVRTRRILGLPCNDQLCVHCLAEMIKEYSRTHVDWVSKCHAPDHTYPCHCED